MADMLSRIRQGNVQLKKVNSSSPRAEKKPNNVMAEMAKMLVSPPPCRCLCVGNGCAGDSWWEEESPY